MPAIEVNNFLKKPVYIKTLVKKVRVAMAN